MATRVGICMSTWRGSEWLRRVSLPALLGQTFSDWTLFAVNDGRGEDRTRTLFERLGDPRLRYYEVDRVFPEPPDDSGYELGSPHWKLVGYQASNEALRLIREEGCEYVMLLDQDDAWLPEHAASLVEALDKTPSAAFAYSDAVWHLHDRFKHAAGRRVQDGHARAEPHCLQRDLLQARGATRLLLSVLLRSRRAGRGLAPHDELHPFWMLLPVDDSSDLPLHAEVHHRLRREVGDDGDPGSQGEEGRAVAA